MHTICFYNQKGGVGKTTSSVTIAQILASYDKKVLIGDLDPQSNTTSLLGKVPVGAYIDSLFTGKPLDRDTAGFSLEDVLLDTANRIDVHEAITETAYIGLDLLPTFLTLSAAEGRLKDDVVSPQQFRLKKHLDAIEDEYDYCILDCSPSISIVNINGLAAADLVYVPMTPDAYAIAGAATVKTMISSVAEYNPKLRLGGVFFTKWNARKRVNRETAKMVNYYMPNQTLPYNIPISHFLEENTFLDKAEIPESTPAAKVYLDFAKHIMDIFE